MIYSAQREWARKEEKGWGGALHSLRTECQTPDLAWPMHEPDSNVTSHQQSTLFITNHPNPCSMSPGGAGAGGGGANARLISHFVMVCDIHMKVYSSPCVRAVMLCEFLLHLRMYVCMHVCTVCMLGFSVVCVCVCVIVSRYIRCKESLHRVAQHEEFSLTR